MSGSSGWLSVGRSVWLDNSGAGVVHWRLSGASSWNSLQPGGSTRPYNYPYNGGLKQEDWQNSWPGSGVSVQLTNDEVRVTIEYSTDGGATVAGNHDLVKPECLVTVTGGGGGANALLQLDDLRVDLGAENGPQDNDPYADPIPDDVEAEQGVLMFDNRVPGQVDIELGDELLSLEPGYNFFPFDGALDEDGEFPQVFLDEEIPAIRKVAPDGTVYWYAQLNPGPDSTVDFNPSPTGPIEVLPPSVSGGGPTMVVPGMTEATTDYVGIPTGVLPGNNPPLPGGLVPGGASELPEGVTPGTNGALRSGTVSGGSNYLPEGVSPGMMPQPDSGGDGGTGGGGIVLGGGGGGTGGATAGAVTQNSGEGYVPGASMDSMADDAKSQGAQWAEGIGKGFTDGLGEMGDKAKGFFGEGGFKFWEGEGELTASDSSWLEFELPIDEWAATITIPNNIVALIRAILVWGVKIWFVISVIRLFMK